MASLPENWESDYDGSRWFYRFKPTGLVQYHFPKPGDEFPEFVDAFAPRFDLAPEEKLESQHQLKRRSTTSTRAANAKSQTSNSKRDGSTSATLAGPHDWFHPDNYMYLGPEGSNDLSALDEDEENGNKDEGGASPGRKNKLVSPVTSAGTTPNTTLSNPVSGTPILGESSTGGSRDGSAVDPRSLHPAEVPMLDGRQISPSPLGTVPELASETTGQCIEEMHPAPVELPVQHYSHVREPEQTTVYTHVFDMAPAELPAHTSPVERTKRDALDDQKVLRSPEMVPQRHPGIETDVSRTIPQPSELSSQHVASQPHTQTQRSQSKGGVSEPPPTQYQSYNPAAGRVVDEAYSKRNSAVLSQFTVVEHQERELGVGNKRHSIAGATPAKIDFSDIPAALQPPRVPPKLQLDSQSGDGQGNRPEISHVPSVLKPARGRPGPVAGNPTQPLAPLQEETWQPPKAAYAAYNPIPAPAPSTGQLPPTNPNQVPQRPVALAQPTGGTQDPQPGLKRTSTLPIDMPSLPFMGGRPSIPHHAQSYPVLPQSHQGYRQTAGGEDSVKPSAPQDSVVIANDPPVSVASHSTQFISSQAPAFSHELHDTESASLVPKPLAFKPRPENQSTVVPPTQPSAKKQDTAQVVPPKEEPAPLLTANFASAHPPRNRPQQEKPSTSPDKRRSEEFPKYMVSEESVPPGPLDEKKTSQPLIPSSSLPVDKPPTLDAIASGPSPPQAGTTSASLEPSMSIPQSAQDIGKVTPIQQSGGGKTSTADPSVNTGYHVLAQEPRPSVEYHQDATGQQRPGFATAAHWPQDSPQRPTLDSTATNSSVALQSRPTPPLGQNPTAPPSQGNSEASPAMSLASIHRLSMSSSPMGAYVQGAATPPPGAQQPASRVNQSPHSSISGSPSTAHRLSLSGVVPTYRPSGQPAPPLPTQNLQQTMPLPLNSQPPSSVVGTNPRPPPQGTVTASGSSVTLIGPQQHQAVTTSVVQPPTAVQAQPYPVAQKPPAPSLQGPAQPIQNTSNQGFGYSNGPTSSQPGTVSQFQPPSTQSFGNPSAYTTSLSGQGSALQGFSVQSSSMPNPTAAPGTTKPVQYYGAAAQPAKPSQQTPLQPWQVSGQMQPVAGARPPIQYAQPTPPVHYLSAQYTGSSLGTPGQQAVNWSPVAQTSTAASSTSTPPVLAWQVVSPPTFQQTQARPTATAQQQGAQSSPNQAAHQQQVAQGQPSGQTPGGPGFSHAQFLQQQQPPLRPLLHAPTAGPAQGTPVYGMPQFQHMSHPQTWPVSMQPTAPSQPGKPQVLQAPAQQPQAQKPQAQQYQAQQYQAQQYQAQQYQAQQYQTQQYQAQQPQIQQPQAQQSQAQQSQVQQSQVQQPQATVFHPSAAATNQQPGTGYTQGLPSQYQQVAQMGTQYTSKPNQGQPLPMQAQGQAVYPGSFFPGVTPVAGATAAQSPNVPYKVNTAVPQGQQFQQIDPSLVQATPAGSTATQPAAQGQVKPQMVIQQQPTGSAQHGVQMQLNVQVQQKPGQVSQQATLPQQPLGPSYVAATPHPGMATYPPKPQQAFMAQPQYVYQTANGQTVFVQQPQQFVFQQQQPQQFSTQGFQPQQQHPTGLQSGQAPVAASGQTVQSPQSAGTPGKEKKDWFGKVMKSDAFKKTGFAIGGALIAETMGGSVAAGAKIGANIFDTTKKNKLQKPPPSQQALPQQHQPMQQYVQMHPQGMQTAPPVMQGLQQPPAQPVSSPVAPGTPQNPTSFTPPIPSGHQWQPVQTQQTGHAPMGSYPSRPPLVSTHSAPGHGQTSHPQSLASTAVDSAVQSTVQSVASSLQHHQHQHQSHNQHGQSPQSQHHHSVAHNHNHHHPEGQAHDDRPSDQLSDLLNNMNSNGGSNNDNNNNNNSNNNNNNGNSNNNSIADESEFTVVNNTSFVENTTVTNSGVVVDTTTYVSDTTIVDNNTNTYMDTTVMDSTTFVDSTSMNDVETYSISDVGSDAWGVTDAGGYDGSGWGDEVDTYGY